MSISKRPRILLCGGGTGGHVFPLLAVAEYLKKNGADLLFVGSAKGPESILVFRNHFKFIPIQAGKWRRYLSFWNLVDIGKIFVGFWQSLKIIKNWPPDVIFAKGGYVSLPPVLAGRLCQVPIITHESDVLMGLANRIISRLATRVCVSFESQNYQLPKDKVIYTGNPIRRIFSLKQLSSPLHTRPTVLVMGGSQGSRIINNLIGSILPVISPRCNILHITGSQDFPKFQDRHFLHYRPYEFVDEELPRLMARASLIISRSGANSIFEIATLGKPSILIPYAAAAGEHQMSNAQIFKKAGAAIVLDERGLKGEKLINKINELLKDRDELKSMGLRARALAPEDSAKRVAQEIFRIIERSEGI